METCDSMKVLLCVPSYSPDIDRDKWENEIKEFSEIEKIDLIIFPEEYITDIKFEQALEKVKEFSKKFNTAVLLGIKTKEGYQIAVFYNPNPQKKETKEHIYIKHSTAEKLAYEYPDYQGKEDKMFKPIHIKGRKLGVMICHDMFFPLIPHNLVKQGVEILIDITGGNVNYKKWKNVIKGRSIEIKNTFLCTMGYDCERSQRSYCFAYHNGKVIPVYCIKGRYMEIIKDFKNLPEPPYFCMLSIPPKKLINEEEYIEYTEKTYSDITIALYTEQYTKKKADIEITRIGSEFYLILNGKRINLEENNWVKIGDIGLLSFPLTEIIDPTLILRSILNLKNSDKKARYYLVLYYGESELTESEVISLAKLRAIENRVGVIVFSKDIKLVLKTNNYKQIQFFKEKNGVYGINKMCLGGPESVFTSGIPVKFKEKYLKLL